MPELVQRAPAGTGYAAPTGAKDGVRETGNPAGVGVAGAGGGNAAELPIDSKQPKATFAAKPELAPPQTDKIDWSKMDAQSILALLGIEQNKRNAESTETDLQLTMKQQKEAGDKRLKEIETASKKAQEAKDKENSFWSKFCKVFSAVASGVGSVASIALGAMLASTGVGMVVGGLLIAYGISGVAGAFMDGLVGAGVIKDPGWRPSIASGTTKLLEALGVDPKVAGIIGMVSEFVFVLAVNVAAFSKITSAAKDMVEKISSKLTRAGQYLESGASLARSGTQIGTQVINLQAASLQYDSDMAGARAEEIKAAMARLAKTLQIDMDMIETLIKRIQANTEAVSDAVQGTAEANKSVAANMGHAGSAA